MAKTDDKIDKDSNKIAYDSLIDIHKHIFEQLKYAETKNHILLTFNLALIIMFIRYFFMVEDKFYLFNWWYITNLILLVIPIIFIFKAFFPNLNNSEIHKSNNVDKTNIYFFEHIKMLESSKYLELVLSSISIKLDEITNKVQLLNLSNQIVVISEITSSKHLYYKKAFYYFVIAISFFIVSYILTIGALQ